MQDLAGIDPTEIWRTVGGGATSSGSLHPHLPHPNFHTWDLCKVVEGEAEEGDLLKPVGA